jgi:glycosyltransferase involved in cell wall biosynthesis
VVESLLHRTGVPIVLDIDDPVYLPYEGRPLLSRKFPALLSRCALVLAGNRYLQEYALQFNPNSVLFPTVVDDARITPDGTRANPVPVVGWIGSPVSVVALREIAPALDRAHDRSPFRLLVVGADEPGVTRVPYDAVPWSEDTEVRDLRSMDIGVMPLQETEWSRGKCALKLLQYMSAGVATVSSPTASVPDIVDPGVNGAVASTAHDWEREVAALVSSAEARAVMGANARRWLESNYTLARYGPYLVRCLQAAAAGRGVPDDIDAAAAK